MSERFDALFDALRGQDPPLPFAPAAAVRRRGRQRAHRQAATAGAAVLAVAGLGTGGLVTVAGPPESPPPPAATSTEPGPPTATRPATASPTPVDTPGPAPTAISPDWFLTAADLGDGDWRRQDSHELLDSAWWWVCPALAADEVPSLPLRAERAAAFWVGNSQAAPDPRAQIIELFQPGTGQDNLDDVRAALPVCNQGPPAATEAAPVQHRIIDEGFAGDESLLVRTEEFFYDGDTVSPDPQVSLVAVVRVGDLVTTLPVLVAPAGDEVTPADEDYLRELAASAAARLG